MSVDIEIKCDSCKGNSEVGEPVYCDDCHTDLKMTIEEYEGKIADLEAQIRDLS